MKTNKFLLAFAVAALTCSSCGGEVDEVLDVKEGPVETQDSVFTYDMVFDCDITSYDGTTRATAANDWKNGDVVYLRFYNDGSWANAKAEYISSSKKWRVTCEKALVEASNSTCTAWYGEGVNPISNGDIIFDYMTAAYLAYDEGSYTCSGNSIYISVTMLPVGCRLRFKGTAGTNIRIYCNKAFYYNFQHTQYIYPFFWYSEGAISLTVGSNGYTDYFVVYRNNELSNIYLQNLTTGDGFTRYFDSNTLKDGESGYFTIPTTSNLRGWTRTIVPSGNFNDHDYVDLGLPSGARWAICNVGATNPEEFGGYYAWGETEEKSSYDWSNYAYCSGSKETCYSIGNNIAGSSQYDVARSKWGGYSWRMPNESQVQELIDNCTMSWILFNGKNGILVKGPNGNSIFLPAAGYKTGTNYDEGSFGAYWASTPSSSSISGARYLLFAKDNWWITTEDRCLGFTVRPVYN